jgi:type I restriction enzyme M protein
MGIINADIEKRLWDAADSLRSNSKLKASEYATPVLGLIFLRYADYRFAKAKAQMESELVNSRRQPSKIDYQRLGVLYLPETARYQNLLQLPEDADVQTAVIQAMKDIEAENDDLKDVLPKTYKRIPKDVLLSLLKTFSFIEMQEYNGDTFGAIYEYFLGKFALSEGQKGGEFFTPTSLVRLIVEILEPHKGQILDPACGSGGMFVQSAKFVERHSGSSATDISIYGQEKVDDTVRLCKMNIAVHGLTGQVKPANTYYENIHQCYNRFDYVMANPPFNGKGLDKERLKGDKRFPFGLPSTDNANYIWIQEFYSALNPTGKAGFVMANSASDARNTELEIRKRIIQDKVVDVMISIGSNFFYTVTLPCTLWFFDKSKHNTDRGNCVLFIDAREIFTQVDRAHREFSPMQIEAIANIVRLYRGEPLDFSEGSGDWINERFTDGVYNDIAGLCKVATLGDIEKQGWSLNPGRYIGTTANKEIDEDDFIKLVVSLNEELTVLNMEAHELERKIANNFLLLVRGNE